MTLHKLTAGDGYTYLTRQVAAQDASEHGFDSLGDYYEQKGETPGIWMGSGCSGLPQFLGGRVTEAQMLALFGEGRHPDAVRIETELRLAGHSQTAILVATRLGSPFPLHDGVNEFRRRTGEAFGERNAQLGFPRDWPLPADERAAIRTRVAHEMFAEKYGRKATDARELSGFVASASRQATTAVAGYDLTFSPVKSVSALWALAPLPVAAVIEQAHQDAVSDTLRWLEEHAAFTRVGRAGVRQVEVTGLIAAAFTHRDSRAGDPDLHTHVAVSNKVQSRLDGRWLALDGRPLHKMAVAASERYNTRIESLLRQRLGVRFADRAGGDPGKRPVREIVGLDERILTRWSQRRAQIDERRAELATDFQTAQGRPPTAVEALALAQQANLETRQGKHEPRARAEQRATWRTEAGCAVEGLEHLDSMIDRLLRRRPQRAVRLTTGWIDQTAIDVLATVQAGRATWQETHVRAEAERFVRGANVAAEQVDEAVDAIVTAALDRSIRLGTPEPIAEPEALRRSDGTSVYVTAGSQLYTSAQILAAEHRLIDHAGAHGARVVSGTAVEIAVVEAAANGVDLNPGQVQLVRELACSGARLQLALAPAGTGKTVTLRALAAAWHTTDQRGRTGHVLGLAPSAAAAAVLREEIGAHTDTLAKLLHTLDHPEHGTPQWVAAIGPDTLAVIDEAGMAGTCDLARAIEHIIGRGGAVRLIGDDQQLAAVAAGGVLRDIAHQAGAVHLSQVMRFTDPAEAAASLALRAGDPAAIGYYLDHRRVHVGDHATVTHSAYRAWRADRAAGADSIMIAGTRETVATLNARARADRLAASGHVGREAALADGSHASAGDVIITRRNDRRLPITATDFVKNGDRWSVLAVTADGAITARHHGTGRRIQLPVDYVREHVTLGYAATVHATQGITADTSHLVATGEESRQLLYVAMTRGRTANHLYLATAGDGDPHSVITRDALLPPTPADILTRILARDSSQTSATSTGHDLDAVAARLAAAATRYQDALLFASASHLGPAAMDDLAVVAESTVPGVTSAEAWPSLHSRLALLSLAGVDPRSALRAALEQRDVGASRDLAAVLDWRLDAARDRDATGPLPWLPPVPARLADDMAWGQYLAHRAALISELAEQARAEASGWTATDAPAWAAGLLGAADGGLLGDLAVWRAATGIEHSDRDPTGPKPHTTAEARYHQQLVDRVHAARGRTSTATGPMASVVQAIDARITGDPYWPQLAKRLAAARRAGIGVDDLVRAVAADGPLPDEYPAAALWWRLSRHLSPAALAGDRATVATLRPDWTDNLAGILGDAAAARVIDDPAWPALVAAVTLGRAQGWQPAQLLATAHDLLDSGHPDDAQLPEHELATALVWRIGLLTDPAGRNADTGEPPITELDLSAAEIDDHVPDDLDQYPTTGAGDDLPHPMGHGPVVPVEQSTPPAQPPVVWVAADPDGGVNADALFAYPSGSGVLRDRLVELNTQVHDYYTGRYERAWAPDYLADRLGPQLVEQARDRYVPGYAPDQWTALTDHLRRLGAQDSELLAAGLAVRARTGRLIDRFRDRLVMPIWNGDEVHGFIARRNPTRSDNDLAGPKYLNTADTDLFRKGAQLYGLHEARDLLTVGATPVIVEGPLDAWAITFAGDGRYVGVAPLGTALTDQQADQLRPYIRSTGSGVLVATDNDPAGRKAASSAYWRLTARGDAPRHVALPAGADPADLLRQSGTAALRDALDNAQPLVDVLLDTAIDSYAERLDTIEGRVAASRVAADIISALPPDEWLRPIEHVQERLGLLPGSVHAAVMDAADVRSNGSLVTPQPHMTERRPTAHQNAPMPTVRPVEGTEPARNRNADRRRGQSALGGPSQVRRTLAPDRLRR